MDAARQCQQAGCDAWHSWVEPLRVQARRSAPCMALLAADMLHGWVRAGGANCNTFQRQLRASSAGAMAVRVFAAAFSSKGTALHEAVPHIMGGYSAHHQCSTLVQGVSGPQ
jgi:hypothetical protein